MQPQKHMCFYNNNERKLGTCLNRRAYLKYMTHIKITQQHTADVEYLVCSKEIVSSPFGKRLREKALFFMFFIHFISIMKN